MRSPVTVLAATLGLALVSCGGDGPAGNSTTSTAATPQTSTTISPITTLEEDLAADSEIAEAAIAALAEHLTIPTDAIEVLTARQVTWPDGALGCPQPGEMYTQALVEGYQVVLAANERVYVYHAGSDGEPFLCPSEDKDGGYDFVPPPGDIEQ